MRWAVEALQYDLVDQHFTLVTDQPPLQWQQDTKSKITRWFRSLQGISFKVPHRALSRQAAQGTGRLLAFLLGQLREHYLNPE